MKLALIGFGNVGRAFARLLEAKQNTFPFRICAIHTRSGTAYGGTKCLPVEPEFGPPASSVDEFLDIAQPEIVIELITLSPEDGQPAISYIRSAFARGMHVITANKGPIAHAYASLREEAARRGAEFRFESACMDGAPIFNMVRNNLPGIAVQGFTGVLNSTTKVVLDAMARGRSMADGIAAAQALGIAEADPSYDIDGWDSAAKTAALANVLMDGRVTPQDVERQGIRHLTPEQVISAAARRHVLVQVSCAERRTGQLHLSVKTEEVPETDLLATMRGTSNLVLLHTDLMGTVGTVSLSPGVDQTAYGVFTDAVDIARSL